MRSIVLSYGQFLVCDRKVETPGSIWTQQHVDQGFARRPSTVAFGTLMSSGTGVLEVYRGRYVPFSEHQRVIEVPFEVFSGEVEIGGPDEWPVNVAIEVAVGHYRLVAAQRVLGPRREAIDVYFELLVAPLRQSRIIVADDALNPPDALLETADEP